MSADRYVSVQFCDDIRQETGNKFSLMGCYGPELHITPIPSVLPKLCVMVKIYTPKERPFAKLTVRVLREEKLIGEVAFAAEALAMSYPKPRDGATRHLVNAMMVMSPFPVDAEFALRVEVETEDETLNGGTMWVCSPPSASVPAVSS